MSARLDPILRDLERLRHLFDFDRDRFGESLMDAAVDVIERLMDQESGPDGQSWAALSPAYAEWKAQHAPGPISVLYRRMKTREQLEGQRFVAAGEMRMVYGVDEDMKAEADFFQSGNENQPARPFYEFGAEALTRMDQLCDGRLRGRI